MLFAISVFSKMHDANSFRWGLRTPRMKLSLIYSKAYQTLSSGRYSGS